jgi:TolA-binding protein
MKPLLLFISAALLCPALLPAKAPEESAAEQLRLARRALTLGFPHAFLPSLETISQSPTATPTQRDQARLLLAESLLASDQAAAATELLEQIPPSPGVSLLQAQAWQKQKKWDQALAAYESAASSDDLPLRARAALGAAACSTAQGNTAAARTWLQKIPPDSPSFVPAKLEEARLALIDNQPGQAEKLLESIPLIPPAWQADFTYLKASTLLAQGDANGALLTLGKIGSPTSDRPADEKMVVLQARCLLAAGEEFKAESLLEQYLRRALGAAPRLAALELLDSIYASQESPSISELRRLSADNSQPLRSLDAGYFLARAEQRTGRTTSALGWFRRVATEHPSPELAQSARLAAAEILLATNDLPAAEKELAGLSLPEADFLRGQIAYQQNDFHRAEAAFARALASPTLHAEALFNAAVSRTLAREPGEPNPWLSLLENETKTSHLANRLRLLTALEAARQRSPRTDDLFRDAWPDSAIPWAEWRLISSDSTGATRLLLAAQASADSTDPESSEFLQIFLSDDGTPTGQERAMAAAKSFLQKYPDSSRLREATFKLAELEFNRGDYLAARARLEQLATDFPTGPEGQQAWFLAGVASARLLQEDAIEQALLHFEEAAKTENELGWRARFEQALLLSARGAPNEALVLLNRVLAGSTDPSLRSATLIEKGDTLFALASAPGAPPETLEEAISTWQDLGTDPAAPLSWKEQALVKAGTALEKAQRPREALQNYYRVLLGREAATPEDFWFFKAGFEAARILESQADWAEAIRIYERLGQMQGPRAAEASARANRLRLEKFLWNE